MLTQEQVLTEIKAGRASKALYGRDYARLSSFFPASELETLGFSLKEGAVHEAIEWTEENVKAQLAKDLAFAFEKALGKRGISADLMSCVIQTWMWVLEEKELSELDDYPQYGLPILKAVALKFGLPNPIGDDRGDEFKYSAETDY
jgi:hypothetical protein